MGFDDLLLAAHTVPALTTLRMPIAEIVSESVELAIALARDPAASREPRRHGLQADARRAPVDGADRQSGRPTRPQTMIRLTLSGVGRRHPRVAVVTAVTDEARRDPDPHRLDRPVGPGEVGDGPDLDRGGLCASPDAPSPATAATMAAVSPTPRSATRARTGTFAAGSELDLLELEALRQVGRLDAVHERSAFEGDAPADRVDARVGQGRPNRHVQHQGERVTASPDPPVVAAGGRRHRAVGVRSPPGSCSEPTRHQPGTRSDRVHGSSGRLEDGRPRTGRPTG